MVSVIENVKGLFFCVSNFELYIQNFDTKLTVYKSVDDL